MTYESKSLYQKGHSSRFTKGKAYGNADHSQGYPQSDSVLPHHWPVLSTKRPPCLKENGCLLNGHGKWAGGGLEGRDQLPSDLLGELLEQAVLGIVLPHGFQLLLSFHWWIISWRGLDVMCGSVQAEDARIDIDGWLVYPKGSRDSWMFASCLGQKKKEPEITICLKGNWCRCGKLFTWSLPTHSPQTQHWNLLPKNSREEIRKRGSWPSLGPSLWNRTVAKTQYSPFLPLTLGLPYQD